jgi:hypothetical protein
LIDWDQFDRDEEFGHYFRYKLHEKDFRPAVDGQGRTVGHFYAKPLYGRLDDRGWVDKSGGFNGEIAIAFTETEEGHLTLLFTHLSKVIRALEARPDDDSHAVAGLMTERLPTGSRT